MRHHDGTFNQEDGNVSQGLQTALDQKPSGREEQEP